MAKFLTSDKTGKKVKLPVIRLDKGKYLIGLLIWEIKLDNNFRLVAKPDNTQKWFSFKSLILNTEQLQLDAIEELMMK